MLKGVRMGKLRYVLVLGLLFILGCQSSQIEDFVPPLEYNLDTPYRMHLLGEIWDCAETDFKSIPTDADFVPEESLCIGYEEGYDIRSAVIIYRVHEVEVVKEGIIDLFKSEINKEGDAREVSYLYKGEKVSEIRDEVDAESALYVWTFEDFVFMVFVMDHEKKTLARRIVNDVIDNYRLEG